MLVITITIGKQTEQGYQALFNRKCPRPVRIRNLASGEGIFKDCLMVQWQPLIQETISDLLVDPPKINQLIKGRTGNRSFNQEKTEELVSIIESKVREKIRKTDEGIAFYKEGKNTSVKALTFCILGCQLLQIAQERWNLSKIKAKIINKTIVHYYLEEANITNADIQEIEQQIIAREKNQEKNETEMKIELENLTDGFIDPFTEEIQSEDSFSGIPDVQEIVEENHSSRNLLLFPEKLEQVNLFTIENYFLKGDPLLDKLLDICPKNEKRAITCNEIDENYWLAARKIIHLFIYQNSLFKTIDLSATCLQEQKVNIAQLREELFSFIEENVNWNLSKEDKNKLILCTLCHLIRQYKLLGQLDLTTAVKSFFIFLGKIYQLPDKELLEKMNEVINQLQINGQETIGISKKFEEKSIITLLQELITQVKSENQELRNFLMDVWKNNRDFDKYTPEEISEFRRRARRIVKERNHLLPQIWEQSDYMRPYLAVELLEEMGEIENQANELPVNSEKLELTFDIKNMSREEELFFRNFESECNKCKKNWDDCSNYLAKVRATIDKGKNEIKELWENTPEFQPCIAKNLLEKRKEG